MAGTNIWHEYREVAFAADEPLRIECRDGLVRLRVALGTLQSGCRAWHDIVAHVAYRPVTPPVAPPALQPPPPAADSASAGP